MSPKSELGLAHLYKTDCLPRSHKRPSNCSPNWRLSDFLRAQDCGLNLQRLEWPSHFQVELIRVWGLIEYRTFRVGLFCCTQNIFPSGRLYHSSSHRVCDLHHTKLMSLIRQLLRWCELLTLFQSFNQYQVFQMSCHPTRTSSRDSLFQYWFAHFSLLSFIPSISCEQDALPHFLTFRSSFRYLPQTSSEATTVISSRNVAVLEFQLATPSIKDRVRDQSPQPRCNSFVAAN